MKLHTYDHGFSDGADNQHIFDTVGCCIVTVGYAFYINHSSPLPSFIKRLYLFLCSDMISLHNLHIPLHFFYQFLVYTSQYSFGIAFSHVANASFLFSPPSLAVPTHLPY